jgi:hypothetical protein
MPDNPNTDNPSETPYPDSEDWQVVFQAYATFPVLAFILAQYFDCLKGLVQRGPQGALEAVATFDLAIAALQPHTKYRDADRDTYHLAVTGKLSPKDDIDDGRKSK